MNKTPGQRAGGPALGLQAPTALQLFVRAAEPRPRVCQLAARRSGWTLPVRSLTPRTNHKHRRTSPPGANEESVKPSSHWPEPGTRTWRLVGSLLETRRSGWSAATSENGRGTRTSPPLRQYRGSPPGGGIVRGVPSRRHPSLRYRVKG